VPRCGKENPSFVVVEVLMGQAIIVVRAKIQTEILAGLQQSRFQAYVPAEGMVAWTAFQSNRVLVLSLKRLCRFVALVE